ncbi:MAG TPA: YbjN domain-containing protein [Candidatus Ozemobacteraceae bacterium]|nr:YbjN domain-containing protein [Candidatus Ozemobacteraceae bacterium]
MKPEQPAHAHNAPQASAWEIGVIKTVAGYLAEEGYRFQYISDACLELYLQGKSLTMRVILYAHNRHLVVRVPAFIRNMELRRMDLLLVLMQIMDEYFDIRFELAKDGQSLSAACTHILEDGALTKAQCMQTMMVVAYIVDDCYPKLMHLIYGGEKAETIGDAVPAAVPEPGSEPPDDDGDDDDGSDEPEEPSEEGSSGSSASGGKRVRSTRHTKIN